ncbi:von Willebrand factor A domain-containing protein 1-like isoform X2 [Babylonia areolata]
MQADVVFVLDSSGSVSAHYFNLMVRFVQDLVKQFHIGTDKVSVGVVTYSNVARTQVDLKPVKTRSVS